MSQLTYEQEDFAGRTQPMDGGALSAELSRYFAVSTMALTVDLCLLYLISEVFGVHYLVANPIAFAFGALVAYIGSVHWAFRHRKLSNTCVEMTIFIIIGVGGLAINEAILWLGIEFVAVSLVLAKVVAALTSFAFNFVGRKMVLFSA